MVVYFSVLNNIIKTLVPSYQILNLKDFLVESNITSTEEELLVMTM